MFLRLHHHPMAKKIEFAKILGHQKGSTFGSVYSNTSQTRGSKLAEFSNSRFLSLFFTSKLAVPLLSTQIRDFCYFLSPKIREFGGITVHTYVLM